jgi:hypothetical protein
MGLVGNCFRACMCPTGMDIYGTLPGQEDGYDRWDRYINPDGATAIRWTAANPTGYYLGGCYAPPITIGEMSWCPTGDGAITANLYPSRAMAIDLTGAGDFDATAALVISMAMALTGSGTMTATLFGNLNMSADFTGSGGLDATMSGIASMAIDLLGVGDLEATIAAYGDMAIDIVVTGTGLSTANVGQAVWDFLIDGTEAQDLLAAAGSAGDPWITSLPGTYTGDQAGAIIAKLNEAIENGMDWQQLLRVMVAALVGKSSKAGSIWTYKGVDGTTNRVVATIGTDKTRSSVVLDGD